MRKRMTAIGGSFALIAAAIVIPALPAAAALYEIDFADQPVLTEDSPELEWSVQSGAAPICAAPSIRIWGQTDVNGAVTVNADGLGGTINLQILAHDDIPDAGLIISCTDDGNTYSSSSLPFTSVVVAKIISGPHLGYEYGVEVEFESADDVLFTVSLTFDAMGGSELFYVTAHGTWLTTETDTGGADRSDIDFPELEINPSSDVDYVVTVINTFAPEFYTEAISPQGEMFTDPVLEWDFSNQDAPPICDNPEISAVGTIFEQSIGPGYGDIDPPFEVTVNADRHSGTIDISNSPGSGFQGAYLNCVEGNDFARYIIDLSHERFTLTKEVEGDAPTDSAFVIAITSSIPEDFDEPAPGSDSLSLDVIFDATGGTQTVYRSMVYETLFYWTVAETDVGGAESTTVVERNFGLEFDASTEEFIYSTPFATVTNVFPIPETPDTPDEEEPAPPVGLQPPYAG